MPLLKISAAGIEGENKLEENPFGPVQLYVAAIVEALDSSLLLLFVAATVA